MVFVFSSDDPGFAEYQARQAILKDHPGLDLSISFSRFDGSQDSLSAILNSLESMSFFGGTRVVLVVNPLFLADDKTRKTGVRKSAKKKAGQKDPDNGLTREQKMFIQYLSSADSFSDLYICTDQKIGSGPLAQALKSSAQFKEYLLPQGEEATLLAMQLVSAAGSTIEREAATEVVARAGDSWWNLKNSIDKLSLYSDRIKLADVEALIPRKPEDRIYTITGFLLAGRGLEAVKSYRDLRRNRDPLSILPFLFSEFRLDAMTLYLNGRRLDYAAIASELKINSYRAKMILRNIRGRLTYARCIRILADLGRMERNIKFNLDDADIQIESFLLNFPRRYLGRI